MDNSTTKCVNCAFREKCICVPENGTAPLTSYQLSAMYPSRFSGQVPIGSMGVSLPLGTACGNGCTCTLHTNPTPK